jgi:hypothetical protein
MKTITILTLAILTVALAIAGNSKSEYEPLSSEFQKIIDQEINADRTIDDIEWRGKTYAQIFDVAEQDGDEIFGEKKILSTKKAFALSFVLPGAGQIYAKSPVKAGLFFVLEAGLWTGFMALNNTGYSKRDEYEDYHDDNFDVEKYLNWYLRVTDVENGDLRFPEQIPHRGENTNPDDWYDVVTNHDYYEMTGKYSYFLIGWKDIRVETFSSADWTRLNNPDATDEELISIMTAYEDNSTYKTDYMQMRQDANEYFIFAKYALGAALFNHVVAAFDAAWTAHKQNEKLSEGFSNRIFMETDVAVHEPTGAMFPEIALKARIR